MAASLEAAANRPLFSSDTKAYVPEVLPNIYTATSLGFGGMLSATGHKYMLPVDTTREEHDAYVEVVVPPAKTVPPRATERLIPIVDLDPICKGSFPGYTSLNRIQSIIYNTVYGTNENMLICAPTGAGKTDVAMLSVLRVIHQHLSPNASNAASLAASIQKNQFKIIYVAPMKALAAEIVRKLGKRLEWLSIAVRELTGDMQLTQAEIAATQIIVTTPEKWDVVTRKPTGEGELASRVKLLIIDEVHLLNEERGAVIETIVARTLRQVESTQSLIRVVGLSATLPNYRDVAEFLGVNPHQGLFFFDSSFRPIPLEQHFLGIKGKPGSAQSKKNIDAVAFEKVAELVRAGHQCMVFVHARKDTVKTALALKDAAIEEGSIDDFSCQELPGWYNFRRDVGSSRNREMRELFDHGFGIHHAGMLRADRNITERLFAQRAIKVLVCTATLAWGVNLPAHAVVIKGTQVYDTGRGKFVDLSVLDVLQIFGRAGRPGLESSGEGYILTTEDKLTHYLDAVTSQHPIESKFEGGLVDSLNAEISLGTVSNVPEAMQWLSYTYLFVRMRRNPFVYGMPHDEPANDPELVQKRNILVTAAARKLAEARMITFDQATGKFTIADLGRIAARYYIRHASIEVFNKELRPVMSEADVLAVVSMSTEFDQIQLRESEVKELKVLMDEIIPCEVKGGTDTSQGKVNILLQAYVSQAYIEDFALVSDTAYAAQNGARIMRALLEIALSRKWATVCAVLMSLSKAVEKRMWPFDHPLKQADLSRELLYNLERSAEDVPITHLAAQTPAELGDLLHMNERHGAALHAAASRFPAVDLTYDLRPLSFDLLRIVVHVRPTFEWSAKIHGGLEPWWIWIEDEKGVEILQWSNLPLRQSTKTVDISFVIPIREAKPPACVRLRAVSDRWLGAEHELEIPLKTLIMPPASVDRTALLDLPFLQVSALRDATAQNYYSQLFRSFNALQTQAFWTIYNTKANALLCAPSSCGKSTLGQAALCKAVATASGSDALGLVIVPSRSAAKEAMFSLRRLCHVKDLALELATSPDALTRRVHRRVIRVATSACLFAALPIRPVEFAALRVVLCDDLHLLDGKYELGVSMLMHAMQSQPVRILGLSESLDDPSGLARWLRVDDQSLYCFRPSDRDQALAISTKTFSIPHSAALFKAMAKPAHSVIISRPLDEATIIFVPSRFHCKAVAADLITQCAAQLNTNGFLGHTSREGLEPYVARLVDQTLADPLYNGIGVYHDGVNKADQTLVLQLFLEGVVRVLVAPREACWTIPVRAGTAIVMGTQYTRVVEGDDKQVADYTPQEVMRMLGRAIRHGRAGQFHLFCQAEALDTFMRFINHGLTLESQLAGGDVLRNWMAGRRRDGSITGKQDAVDALSFTYLARRLRTNPAYYDAVDNARDDSLSRVVDAAWDMPP
ncbi:Sec63-domain-containing protein [Auricularia subglabra TFB-10046 SS5]|nr:Sec63-domain-containing protein [Auricularia subglabra TFB-10046 SS5]